jgi:hypothetical protein
MVSHDYDFGEWPPDLAFEMDAPGKPVGRDQKSKVFYWVVPAKASGKWRWQLAVEGKPHVFELDLKQKFQKISGTLATGVRKAGIEDARLVGEKISFAATVENGGAKLRYVFSGRITKNSIEGDASIMRGKAVSRAAWRATRTEFREPAHVGLPPPKMPELK